MHNNTATGLENGHIATAKFRIEIKRLVKRLAGLLEPMVAREKRDDNNNDETPLVEVDSSSCLAMMWITKETQCARSKP